MSSKMIKVYNKSGRWDVFYGKDKIGYIYTRSNTPYFSLLDYNIELNAKDLLDISNEMSIIEMTLSIENTLSLK